MILLKFVSMHILDINKIKNVQKKRAFLILRNISKFRQGYIFLFKLKYIKYKDKNNKIKIDKY